MAASGLHYMVANSGQVLVCTVRIALRTKLTLSSRRATPSTALLKSRSSLHTMPTSARSQLDMQTTRHCWQRRPRRFVRQRWRTCGKGRRRCVFPGSLCSQFLLTTRAFADPQPGAVPDSARQADGAGGRGGSLQAKLLQRSSRERNGDVGNDWRQGSLLAFLRATTLLTYVLPRSPSSSGPLSTSPTASLRKPPRTPSSSRCSTLTRILSTRIDSRRTKRATSSPSSLPSTFRSPLPRTPPSPNEELRAPSPRPPILTRKRYGRGRRMAEMRS